MTLPVCDLGRVELDQSRYCFTHGGFNYWFGPSGCDKRPATT